VVRGLRRAALVAVAGACVAAAAPGAARATVPLRAMFAERSYRPGQTAQLRVLSAPSRRLVLALFRAGDDVRAAEAGTVRDRRLAAVAVAPSAVVRIRVVAPVTVRVRVGAWPSGVYVARLIASGGERTYAPFVLRPARLGAAGRVLVVEPTYTWAAYDFDGGGSWYVDPAVHVVRLDRPYLGDGLPPHFRGYDLGFLRWYARSGRTADFVSDEDLERFVSAAQLRRLYKLIVFPGHEEYVTGHVYDLVEGFRDRGGSLAFLSADNFFYAVSRAGAALIGRTRWRDLGRPEAALVGAAYVGWDERRLPNRRFTVESVAGAPWLFAGTGLRHGARFGSYGIEIDARTPDSPPGTRVLCSIRDAFGPGLSAEMTYYRRGRAQVFDAGVMNFGASATWPVVSTLVDNLWRHLLRG
jgi:hypothetical protein